MLVLLQALEVVDDVVKIHPRRRFLIDEDFQLNFELLAVLRGGPKPNPPLD